MRCGWW